MFRILLLCLALSACANQPLSERANNAAIGDGVSTVAAVAAGASELNPLGLATAVAKYPVLEYCKTLAEGEQAECYAAASAVWSGAAINNACVIVALLTSGAIAPACLLGGIGFAAYAWNASAAEREYMAVCAEVKRVWAMDEKCVFQTEARAE